jgi:predicted methyltransferase
MVGAGLVARANFLCLEPVAERALSLVDFRFRFGGAAPTGYAFPDGDRSMTVKIAVTPWIAALLIVFSPISVGAAPALDLGNRAADAVALDAGRHPAEVLAASGIKKGDHVLDVMAGAGYYSELIARQVGAKGHVIALEPPGFLSSEKAQAGWAAMIARNPNIELLKALPGDAVLPSGIDVAFFHLTYHDLYWESEKFAFPRLDPAAFDAKLFKAMKKGGIVIVIDHVGAPGIDPRVETDKVHRIDPAVVRSDFEKAGFRFIDALPILKTPGDNPATLVFDESVRGKTDRFYFRFKKP